MSTLSLRDPHERLHILSTDNIILVVAFHLPKAWLRYWPEGVPQTLTYPEISLPDILAETAKKYPNNTALIFFGNKITYRELDDLCSRFASALVGLGVKKGDRVALFLPNVPQFTICYYGALRAGAIVVPCSPLYKERELEFQLNDSGAETIVALDLLYEHLAPIREKTKLRNVITTTVLDYFPPLLGALAKLTGKVKTVPCPGTISLKELLRRHTEAPPEVSIDPANDPALFQYTGGTTGVPKGAVLTHRNLAVNALQVGSWLPTLREAEEVMLAVLPYFHIFGMTVAMNMPVLRAASMVLLPRFETLEVLKTIQKYGVTLFPGVPTMYIALINHPQTGKFNLKTVRLCISGAAALPVEVMRRFEALTGGRLVEGYGLTETSPVTHCNPLDKPEKVRVGSIGIPFADTDAKIVDIEAGEKDLPVNEVGELVIRGPQVMQGYWKKPEETSYALRDGWLYTGDIAKMDEDGYFYIVDRKKDMINVSGLKVWPREVEEVLYEHPAVKETGVIGIADPYRGETVKAFIVLKETLEGETTADEIIQFCKEKMASFKAPTQVEFVKELPKTAIGKVLRRVLKEEGRK